MKVEVAKTAGFCFGVERAVNMVYKECSGGKPPIYTLGPIIHNGEVVRDLENRGVRVVNDISGIDTAAGGTVIIRSHGVGRMVQERLERSGLTVVDATCPYVKKIHKAAMSASEKGRIVVIVGDPSHPEVIGIKGWAGPGSCVISSPSDVENLPEAAKLTVVCQTTFNHIKFKEIVEKISEMNYDCNVVNTICNATFERQSEAMEIAGRSEAMIVVGDRGSSNTGKLYEICKRECEHTYYVQTLDDLTSQNFPHVGSVGITAGASTPKKIIEEVRSYVRYEL